MASLSRRKALFYLGIGSIGFALGCQSNSVTKQEAMDLMAQVKSLKQIAPSKHSNQYQPPTANELKQFRELADAINADQLNQAGKLAQALDYRLIKFRESSTQQTLLALLENQNEHQTVRGWGSYFINPSAATKRLVEAPHILFDRFTPEIAAQVFLSSHCWGFLMAGAHRNANGVGSADVCDPINSIFQVVHQCWSRNSQTTWQLHGFANPTAKGFPENTQFVLSSGRGDISQPIITLEKNLEKRGFSSYVYNTLSTNSALNQKLNGNVAGTTFRPLAATENVQGDYNHAINVHFVHIEIASDLRIRQSDRKKVSSAIADSIAH